MSYFNIINLPCSHPNYLDKLFGYKFENIIKVINEQNVVIKLNLIENIINNRLSINISGEKINVDNASRIILQLIVDSIQCIYLLLQNVIDANDINFENYLNQYIYNDYNIDNTIKTFNNKVKNIIDAKTIKSEKELSRVINFLRKV